MNGTQNAVNINYLDKHFRQVGSGFVFLYSHQVQTGLGCWKTDKQNHPSITSVHLPVFLS